jgi:CubicO group peptidase (beta-lactamase class C family)
VSEATISDKIVAGSSELDPRKKRSTGENVMSRWKLQAATTALAAMLVAATVSLPVCARELQPLAAATPEQVGMSAERLGRITTALKKEIADGKLPGAVVMVARKGKIIYSDAIGFQDKGANTPMKLDSIFRIYSMTKPLASVAAMMLVEDGVIQLTDPIAKFLPAFKDMQVSVATTGPDGKPTYTNAPAEMTSDHLGTRIAAPLQPGELLLGTPGYTFGLGFAVRQGDGVAGVSGSAGEFMWAGYAGTYFWVDPKEEIVGIYMTQAPSPIRAYYRKMFKSLVYQALVD